MRAGGKKSDSPYVGMKVHLADGNEYGEIMAVYDYGAGDVCDILKLNKKTEMLPLSDNFLIQSPDKKSMILQNFEFIIATPEK